MFNSAHTGESTTASPSSYHTAKGLFPAILAVALLAGCATQTSEISLPLENPGAFTTSGEQKMSNRWWTEFEDPALDAAIKDALASNFELEAAWQRLREANAIARGSGAARFPYLDGQVGAETDLEGNEALQLGLVSGYDVDLWGRIDSAIEASRLRAEASQRDLQTAALTVSAEVARTWFQLTVARQQRDLLEAQEETNQNLLRLLMNRFGSGQIRRVDILRQRQLLEGTRQQLFAAEARVAVLEHQLAVLSGRAPRTGNSFETDSLPPLPPLPDTGVPSDLVQRRPDVQRAFLLMEAADRELAVAISNRYPRLSLSASLSTEEAETIDLFDDWTRSLAANLAAPIFDAGERRAAVDQAEAVRAQRLFEYGQEVITAFQEVEDSLILEARQLDQIDGIQEQLELAEETNEQLQREYLSGVTNYLDVLTALTDTQALQRELLSARLELLEIRIALYRALAGGIDLENPL